MQRHIISPVIIVLTLTLTGIIYGDEDIKMPVAIEGERWEFKASTKQSSSSTTDRLNGNYEVLYLKGQLAAYELVDGQKVGVGSQSKELLERMIAFGQDEQQYLKFPIAVGNKWTANYPVRSPGTRETRRRSAEFKVEEKAQTKTPAGNFQTVRIKGSNYGGAYPQQWDYFYSPDCKCIVKFYYDSAVGGVGGKVDVELTKFNSPK